MAGVTLLIPILLPVIAGLFVFPMKDAKARKTLISIVLIANAAIVCGLAFTDGLSLQLWTIADNMIVGFQLDSISKFFACLMAIIWMLVAFFAYEYIQHEGDESRFLGFYTMTGGILVGLCYSSNLITLYMFFEMMSIMTVPLVIHSRTKEAIAAGMKYLGYSIFGAGFGLFGLFFLNRFAGGNLIF